MTGQCEKCGNERFLINNGVLCTTCYRKALPPKIGICSLCTREIKLAFGGMCMWCYNLMHGAVTVPHRSILLKSGARIKCGMCEIDRLYELDVHHIDSNHENNDLKNLVFLCKNHHAAVTIGEAVYPLDKLI